MSVRVSAFVWAKYPRGGGEMLLALTLADQCTDSGEYIAIDIARFAHKTRQAADTVKAQLRRMSEEGWLERMPGSGAFRISPAWLGNPESRTAPKNDGKKVEARATRLPKDWLLPAEWKEWALKEFPAWTPEFVVEVATRFKDHWLAAAGANARKVEWDATWRNWCRKEPAVPKAAGSTTGNGDGGEWWNSSTAIEKKGAELGVVRIDGELWHQWRDRIFIAAGDGPWLAKVVRGASSSQGLKKAAETAGVQQQEKKDVN